MSIWLFWTTMDSKSSNVHDLQPHKSVASWFKFIKDLEKENVSCIYVNKKIIAR